MAATREITVDSRGRTSLARVRTKVFGRYLATEHEDGTIVLTPAVTVSPAELAALQAEARAQGSGPGEAERHFQAGTGHGQENLDHAV
jgi:hypothetical protein